jgi:SAM-dependent methyltransferase
MLARTPIPERYAEYNRRHGIPYGRPLWTGLKQVPKVRGVVELSKYAMPGVCKRLAGPFAFQPNSPTRAFEYAWCHEVAGLTPGMKAVDLGAGAAGFQFVLAGEGVEVTSVDPLINPPGKDNWVLTVEQFESINRAFGGRVRFIKAFLEEAGLAENSMDRVFSVSVIEHIPAEAVPGLMREVRRILKPGGRFVATIDLFLDVAPFASAKSNKWGTNIDVRALVEASGMKMVVGEPSELLGFPEFSVASVRAKLPGLLEINQVLTQCLVLEKA